MFKKISISILVIFIMSAFFLVGHDYWELHQNGTVVLLYHKILNNSNNGSKYVLDVKNFEEQLSYLKTAGYQTIIPRDISKMEISDSSSKLVILTFDDGTEDHYTQVFPLLKKNDMFAIFFVVTEYINSPGSLTGKQIKEMAENGMEIGSHSYSHPLLDAQEDKKINFELEQSKKDLEEICGQEVISFAPPGGWFNNNVLEIARKVGYQQFYSCEIGTNNLARHPFIYKRIEVLGNMSLQDFKKLLDPPQILSYKTVQSVKFLLHDLIGSKNYQRLAN